MKTLLKIHLFGLLAILTFILAACVENHEAVSKAQAHLKILI